MNAELKEKLSLLESLSSFYLINNLPIETLDKDDFLLNLAYLVKTFSLTSLPQTLKLFHILFSHQDSNVALDCKSLHCIECYAYFMHSYFFSDTNKTCSCTCGKVISPIIRKRILDNYTRIMNLRRQCKICLIQKDLMEFSVIGSHPCLVCTSCIVNRFQFAENSSPCLACGFCYDAESLFIIRSLMVESQPADLVIQVFGKTCKKCGIKKDHRFFMKICINEHECCSDCGKDLGKVLVKKCFECKEDLSILVEASRTIRLS